MNTQEYIRLINNQKENLIKVDMEQKINIAKQQLINTEKGLVVVLPNQ